jgi:hypothetical protein
VTSYADLASDAPKPPVPDHVVPSGPSDPNAAAWEQAWLEETRRRLASSWLVPNRHFHTIELRGESPDTELVVAYTEVDGVTETTRRFALWKRRLLRWARHLYATRWGGGRNRASHHGALTVPAEWAHAPSARSFSEEGTIQLVIALVVIALELVLVVAGAALAGSPTWRLWNRTRPGDPGAVDPIPATREFEKRPNEGDLL